MSDEEQKGFVYNNPTIKFITESMENIYRLISIHKVSVAKTSLSNLIIFLDPAIKSELKEIIEEFNESLKGFSFVQPFLLGTVRRNPDTVFMDCLGQVNDSLYRAGYLSPQTFIRGS
jgi:hypothetical protein